MSDPDSSPRVCITGTQAQLFVTDLTAACDFYVHQLGFTVEFLAGTPAHYAQVSRDFAILNLRQIEGPVFADGVRRHQELLSATLTLARQADVGVLYRQYATLGVTFFRPLSTETWGATTFLIEDPDGNLILFAGPAT